MNDPVAKVSFTGRSGSLNFSLLPDPETGLYLYAEEIIITTADPGATMSYNMTFDDETGMVSFAPNSIVTSAVNTTNACQRIQGLGYPLLPIVFQAVHGTPINIAISVTGATTLKYSYHGSLTRL